MSSLAVVVIPLIIGFAVGGATHPVVGVLAFFVASWVLGMMWQVARGRI